jgi:integrase
MLKKLTIGTIFLSRGRYYWRGILPGEQKRISIPLKPKGSRYATNDLAVAREVVAGMIQQHIFKTSQQVPARIKTIADLSKAYLKYVKGYYQSREPDNIKYAINSLVDYFAAMPAEDFGPLKLKELQKTMIAKELTRGGINKRIDMVKRMFKWAASEQLVSVTVHQALSTVEGLRKGHTKAPESKKVRPVKIEAVDATLPFLGQTVADMVRIQMLTGMRSTEVCIMQPRLIDREGDIWIYRPDKYKSQNHEDCERVIPIGPKAQKIIAKYLFRDQAEYCFKPSESEAGRGWTREGLNPRYDRYSYRRAIRRATSRANREIKSQCRAECPGDRRAAAELYLKRRILKWHPHQIRHTFGTMVRREQGIEAAKAALGHKKIQTTEIYAERDLKLAVDAALKFG